MEKAPIDDVILIRYLEKETNPEEELYVREWMNLSHANKSYFLELTKLWEASNTQKDYAEIDVIKDWKKVQHRIHTLKKEKKTRNLNSGTIWKVAAGFALLLSLTVYQFTKTDTITLIATENNERFVLPDGSSVWLYKDSQLSYNEDFSGTSRNLKLKGEAYFEVEKNPNKPFIVQTNDTETKVLGTKFNLKEENNRAVTLVLVEGSVQFSAAQGEEILIPGEKIISDSSGKLFKNKNQDVNFMSWKTGVLRFEETPVSKVIKDIGHLYHISFSIENNTLLDCSLTMEFEKESLEHVLETLQILYGIEYHQDTEYKYVITGGECS